MKNKIIIILSCLIVLTSFLNVKAVDDVEPPTLKSISIDKKSLYGGEKLTFNIVGDDDLTGLNLIMIEYELSTNSSKKLTAEFTNPASSNSFSYSYKIPEKTVPGTWKMSAIQIWDKSGKRNLYYSTTDSGINFSNCDFVLLENKNYDTTPPVFNDAYLSTKSISAPGKFSLTIKATDNVTSRLVVQVSYDLGGEEIGFNPEYVSSNTYKITIDVPESARYRPVKLLHIVLIDEAQNQTWCAYNTENYTHQDSVVKLTKNLDVTVTNSISDIQAPILKDFSYGTNEVSVPGTMKFLFDATDNGSGISMVSAYFKGYNKDGKQIAHRGINAYPPIKNGKYVGECEFDQYFPDSTFYIDSIEVFDKAGNKTKYSIYGVGGDIKIEKKEFKLKKAIVSDVNTGTMRDDYLDTIQSAKDDAVITLDCSKNTVVDAKAFSNIKGTNKTLVLVNDGIQWIFKGKDIKNSVKKIDTKVKIYAFDDYDNKTLIECFTEGTKGMVIEFASNGLLPGKVQIKIKADYTFRNYIGEEDLFVYHYNNNGLESIAEKIDMTSEGYYQFNIIHNSKYIISKKMANSKSVKKSSVTDLENKVLTEEEKAEITEELSPNTEEIKEESQQINKEDYSVLVIFSISIGVLAVGGFVFRKKIAERIKKLKKKTDN